MPGLPDRPQSIMLGITELNIGGAEKALVELACRLDKNRFRVEVVSLQESGRLAETLQQAGVPVGTLGMRSIWDVPAARRRLWERLSQQKTDILVTFLFHANILGRWAARRAGVLHVNGIRVAEEGSRWHLWADRWTARRGDRYVAVSQHAADRTSQAVPGSRVCTIPNGIDLTKIDQAHPIHMTSFGLTESDRVLLWMGRMEKQKDVMSALRRAAPLAPLFTASRTKLVLVGDGPERAKGMAFAKDHGLCDIVRFVGWSDDPLGWHRRSSGLLITSRWEGMPNVVLEAMGAGNPVISRNFPGAGELVIGGETGWLATDDLTPAIADWLGDSKKGEALGQRGRVRAEQHFTLDQSVARWEEYLLSIAGQG
ncbi:glycosyltransferase [bacterium]|nr:glycosyltransferase [bacterium]